MHEISLGRLLAQLFQVTEQFEMETQPQLLLLQKTMVVAEGVGRTARSHRQHVDAGAAADRGVDAREPRTRGAASRDAAHRRCSTRWSGCRRCCSSLDKVAARVAEGGGLPLHRDSLAAIGAAAARSAWLGLPLWIIALALAAIAVRAVVVGPRQFAQHFTVL